MFDSEYSPPSPTLAITRPDLYRAYNRHSFSHYKRPIIAYVVDDMGVQIRTGPLSSLQVSVNLAVPMISNYVDNTPSELSIYAYISNLDMGGGNANLASLAMQYDDAGNIVQYPVNSFGTVRLFP